MDIHFIEKENKFFRRDKTSQNWESGNWKIAKETAIARKTFAFWWKNYRISRSSRW